MKRSAKVIIGSGKVVDPSRIAKVFVSPRQRAQKTFQLLFNEEQQAQLKDKCETTEEVAEWNYGAYEGLLTAEIRKQREEKGLDKERKWDIWADGCEGGESPSEMAARLDAVIAKIKEIQAPYMHGEGPADVVVVAHGHTLRAFAKRWIGFEMHTKFSVMLEPGGMGVLSYEHHKADEPALALGVNLGTNE